MSFNRQVEPLTDFQGARLNQAMAGIGMVFAVEPTPHPPIEDVLFAASRLGMEGDDFRVLSVLCKWLQVHSARVNVDRLTRLVERCASHKRTRIFWAAVGQWLHKDTRFKRLAARHASSRRMDLFETGTGFQVQRRGEHPWFAGTCLRVPAGTLRDRDSDVLTPQQLATVHRGYRQRIIQGPSYRADMWATLELDASLNPSQLATRTYGSFASAWVVLRDWALCTPASFS